MSVSIRMVSDGQPPTRDTRGLIVEAEDEWVIEGDPSDVEDVRARLSPTVHRRVGAALLVQFVNVVGIIDLPHLGRLHIRSRKWDEGDFERMLEDISREVGFLPFAAGTGAHLPHDRTLRDAGARALSPLRLSPTQSSTRRHRAQLRLCRRSAAFSADPHRRLQSMRRTSPSSFSAGRRANSRRSRERARETGDRRRLGCRQRPLAPPQRKASRDCQRTACDVHRRCSREPFRTDLPGRLPWDRPGDGSCSSQPVRHGRIRMVPGSHSLGVRRDAEVARPTEGASTLGRGGFDGLLHHRVDGSPEKIRATAMSSSSLRATAPRRHASLFRTGYFTAFWT